MVRISGKTFYYFFFVIICLLNIRFFYLIDFEKFNIFGVYYTDIIFLASVIFTAIIIIKKRFILKKNKVMFFTISYLLVTITSGLAGVRTYGQPFYQGFVSQREWISYILLIYDFWLLFLSEKFEKKKIEKILFAISYIYMGICLLQYIIGSQFVFLHVKMASRYGENRYFFDTLIVVYVSLGIIDELTSEKNKNRFIKLIHFIMIGVVLIFVCKTRMVVIAWGISVCMSYMIKSRKNIKKKIFSYILIAMIAFVAWNSSMGQDIVKTINGSSKMNDTLTIRNDGRKYYLNILKESYITLTFGGGFPNLHNTKAQAVTNPNWNQQGTAKLYLSDQGIFGYIYIYGLLGGTIWLITTIFLFCKAWKIYKKTNNIRYFSFLLYDTIGCFSLVPFLFGTNIILSVVVSLIYYEDYLIAK